MIDCAQAEGRSRPRYDNFDPGSQTLGDAGKEISASDYDPNTIALYSPSPNKADSHTFSIIWWLYFVCAVFSVLFPVFDAVIMLEKQPRGRGE